MFLNYSPQVQKKDILEQIETYLEEQNYWSHYSLRKVKVFPVKGTPFMVNTWNSIHIKIK